jgi:hypothetical protein
VTCVPEFYILGAGFRVSDAWSAIARFLEIAELVMARHEI